jgi:carboxypeptidase C (cathepsin A)
VRPFYISLLQNTTIRALIYNGDTDPSLSSFRTQDAWFPYLAQENIAITEVWRPWTIMNKTDVRGYVQEWQNNQLGYLTIRGSGHMVPEFRSQAAYAFMKTWIAGDNYPMYNPPQSARGRRPGPRI